MGSTLLSDSIWQSRRVLVTGAGGFIGRHLVQRLDSAGSHVTSVSLHPEKAPIHGEQSALNLSDFTNVEALIQEEQPEFIFHLAATANRGNDREAIRAAHESVVLPALHIAYAAQSLTAPPRMLFFGSCDEYGDSTTPWYEEQRARPITPYALAKATVTQTLLEMCTHRDARITIVRPSVVYGPGQRPTMFIPEAIHALTSGQYFEMSAGEQTRDFVFVSDVVEAVLRLASSSQAEGEIVNIASGTVHTIHDIAATIARLCHAEHLLRVGAKPYRDGEVMSYAVSNTKLQKLLAWAPPTTLEAGLAQTLEWFQSQRGDVG